jgi:hypothetical protein
MDCLRVAANDHRQLAAGRKHAPKVTQRKPRQIEKHRAKSRKNMIVGTAKIVALRIGDEKRRVLHRCICSFACC